MFGDQYLDDEGMFTALEANVKTYGESLTGTEETYDKNTKVKLTDKTIGAYQKALGEDYKLTTTVTDVQSVEDVKAYTAKMNTQLLANYEISADDISAVSTCTVQVTDAKGTQLAACNLTVVQIGHTWYVDNTTADTSFACRKRGNRPDRKARAVFCLRGIRSVWLLFLCRGGNLPPAVR